MKTLTINGNNKILVLNKFEGMPRYLIRIFDSNGISSMDLSIKNRDDIIEFLGDDNDE